MLLRTATIPPTRSRIKPLHEIRNYRGARRHVVGYSWSRPASPITGMVYDCVLGYGLTAEAALADARSKIAIVVSKGAK